MNVLDVCFSDGSSTALMWHNRSRSSVAPLLLQLDIGNLFSAILRRSFEVIQRWHSYGIDMKPKGHWNFEGHAMPGRRRYHLKYDGWNQKPTLTAKAKSLGVEIYNKTAMNELLIEEETGRVIGAVGIRIQDEEPEMIVFQAKATSLATNNRKESRGPFHRGTDYTFTNPLMNNKFQTIRLSPEALRGEISPAEGAIMEFRPKGR